MDIRLIIDRLERIQKQDGRSSRSMAKAIGVKPSTYLRWMASVSEPDTLSLKLIEAFELRRSGDLLGRRVKDDQVLSQVPEEVAGRVENRDDSALSQLVPGLRFAKPDPHGGPGSGEDRCDDPGRQETAGDEGRRSDAEKALIESCRLQEARKGAEEITYGSVKDNVNHPRHYTRGRFEVIDIIESIVESMDLTPVEAALTTQVVKYIARWKNKGGPEDLKKARWYLERLIGKVDA